MGPDIMGYFRGKFNLLLAIWSLNKGQRARIYGLMIL